MKVLVYSNFSKKIGKKKKSPSSIRNGRFHPSKCRGKIQKMGVLYTHSPKMPGPTPNFLMNSKTKQKNLKKLEKKEAEGGQAHSLSDYGLQLVGKRWSATSGC
jgi:hypothetical protein